MKLRSIAAIFLLLPASVAPLSSRSDIGGSQQRALQKSPNSSRRSRTAGITKYQPNRLQPPFPNGNCGGKVVIIPAEDTFGIDVNLANLNFGGDFMLPPRPIGVWLPPDYSPETGSRHPVLYTHDGQNAYQDSDSWTGTSWRMAGALTRIADHNLLGTKGDCLPIMVLLPSADGDLIPGVRRRHLEYGDSNFPFAQAHADFVAKTVKPLIDSRFSTLSGPEDTFAIGSSLGGQASLHLMLRHPDLFGGVACLSPAFGPGLLDEVSKSRDSLKSKKIYMDIGGDLNDVTVPIVDLFDHLTAEHWWNPGYFWLDTQLQNGVTAMKQALDKTGATCHFREFPGGRHNERAWAQRIHEPLLHLFGED